MILGDNPKRCVIYFIYDKDGIIDDYVINQLKDLRNNAEHIHCVINGKLCHEGKLALEKVADDIYVRENKGVDVGAYKAAIEYLTWDFIRSFDELVFTNNTNFGPVYPFKECFDWAKKQDIDLWGLTWDNKEYFIKNYPNTLHFNSKTRFINSCFFVYRKSLLQSSFLENFFCEIPANCSYLQSGMYFEHSMPGYFEKYGYKYAVYCDTEDDNYPLLHYPVNLLKNYRMPLFKKRSFFHHYSDVLYNTAGEATSDLISYLEKNTDYDMSLVWKSILRTSSLSDIVRCAQLRRILPKDYAYNREVNLRVGIVFHFYYTDLFDENLDYIQMFPKGCGVLITISSKEKKEILQEKLKERKLEVEVVLIENRGRDISSLLVGAKDFVKNYDLICFTHDKKCLQNKPESVGRSWSFKMNENLYGSKEFILNTINMFEKEPFLGMAFPGYPNHAGYIKHDATGWTYNFENTKKLLQDFGINVKINPKTLCVAPLGTCFWFRPKTLEKLLNGFDGNGWEYIDFPAEPTGKDDGLILHAIERAYAYFAQDAGFYSVYLYNDKYAAIDLTNLEFQLYYGEAMRAWCEAFALDAVGHRKFKDVYGRPWTEISDDEIIRDYSNNAIIRKFASDIHYSKQFISSLLFDTGDGFNVEQILFSQNNAFDNKIHKVRFDLKEIKNIKALRFDPLEGFFCKTKILSVKTDNDTLKLNPVCCKNDTDGFDLFYTNDPQYFSLLEGKISFVEITFELKLSNDFEIQCAVYGLNENRNELVKLSQNLNNKCEQYTNTLREKDSVIDKLNNEVNSLYNSRSWKLTKPFRKLMKLLRKLK